MKLGLASDVQKLEPDGAELNQQLDEPINHRNGSSIVRYVPVNVQNLDNIIWTPVLIFLLPSKRYLVNIELLTKAIAKPLKLILRFNIFFLYIEILFWTVSLIL